MNKILVVKDLTICLKNANAVKTVADKVSFEVCRGEVVAMVGESGSGKSSIALALSRLLAPEAVENISGEAKLLAADGTWLELLAHPAPAEWRGSQVAMIFQEHALSLNPTMRCGRQLLEAFGGNCSKKTPTSDRECNTLLQDVQLFDVERIKNSYPHQLSGGERQRVLTAMAVAGGAQLLIADEPTTALDAPTQAEVLKMLKGLQQKRELSLILITHDLGLVRQIADKICVIQAGKLVEFGERKQIFEKPEHHYTQKLLLKEVAALDLFPKEEKIAYPKPLILAFKDIEKVYETNFLFFNNKKFKKKALKNINLELYKEETLAIVGESGSGKTTLGRLAMQLIQPTKGKIEFYFPDNQRNKNQRRIQMIFQEVYSALNPRQTVGDALAEVLAIYGGGSAGKRRLAANALLAQVGLSPDLAARYPHQLSGGERQRVAIARALAAQPLVLVCDECVASLDAIVQQQVLALLKNLQQTHHLSYLFITHNIAVARRISHRIAVMQDGSVVEQGQTAAIFENPAHPYTQKLLACAKEMESAFF